MANELKFLKGSYTNWSGWTKDEHSFYIVEEQGGRYSFYLGDKLIADGLSKAMLAAEVSRAEGAEKGLDTRIQALENLMGGEGVGSVANQIKAAIEALDEEKTGASEDGLVTVKVTEVDGKLNAVVVTTNDIAKASELTALKDAVGEGFSAEETVAAAIAANKKAIEDEAKRAKEAEEGLDGRLDVVEGEGEGSIKKAVADAQTYADTKVAELNAKVTGASAHVSVEIVEENGKLTTVTVAETDIASVSALNNAVSALTEAISDEADTARAAESGLASRLAVIEGDAEGSIKKALVDAKDYADEKVNGLDATVGSQTIAKDKHVAVEVVQVDGKLTAVTVVEDDIASADALTAEKERAEGVEADLDAAIKAETKARQDDVTAINDTIGTVAEGKTVVQMIEDAQAAAKAAATKLAEKTEGHVTVRGAQDETTGAWTYTIAENDIASATGVSAAISAETEARKAAIEALDATVGSQTIAKDKHVAVEVVQVDGKLTAVTVVEDDIASAAVLAEVKKDVDNFFKDATLSEAAKDTLKELQDYITSDVEGAATMTQAIADNKTAIENEVTRAKGEELKLNNAITAETAAREAAIEALDSTKTGEGTFVDVTVAQVNGVITSVTVAENDIASAAALSGETTAREAADKKLGEDLAAEVSARTAADNAINATIGNVVEGKTVVEMIEDAQSAAEGHADSAVATAKAELLGDAAADYNTLGKLEDKIIAAETAAKAAATKLTEDAEGHVTVSGVQDETTGAWTYTIGENDIASASGVSAAITAEKERAEGVEADLDAAIAAEKGRAEAAESGLTAAIAAEQSRATSAETALSNRLDVLEGVTVTGKDAIVVSESGAKANKEVSLKLGTQPAEGEAGIVLSQDENGLVAKLQWGTF